MIAVYHNRASRRITSEAPVMLEDFWTGFSYDGTLYNYSTEGAYVESIYATRPGRKLNIKTNGLSDVLPLYINLAEVRWRSPLPENPNAYTYGVGVKYC
jgi:hypothetical protein